MKKDLIFDFKYNIYIEIGNKRKQRGNEYDKYKYRNPSIQKCKW